jgi:hypothetical protein
MKQGRQERTEVHGDHFSFNMTSALNVTRVYHKGAVPSILPDGSLKTVQHMNFTGHKLSKDCIVAALVELYGSREGDREEVSTVFFHVAGDIARGTSGRLLHLDGKDARFTDLGMDRTFTRNDSPKVPQDLKKVWCAVRGSHDLEWVFMNAVDGVIERKVGTRPVPKDIFNVSFTYDDLLSMSGATTNDSPKDPQDLKKVWCAVRGSQDLEWVFMNAVDGVIERKVGTRPVPKDIFNVCFTYDDLLSMSGASK